MKIRLMNPYYDEEIKVKEDLNYFNRAYENGDGASIRLTQTYCLGTGKNPDYDEKVIFINPRHWAKVEVEK